MTPLGRKSGQKPPPVLQGKQGPVIDASQRRGCWETPSQVQTPLPRPTVVLKREPSPQGNTAGITAERPNWGDSPCSRRHLTALSRLSPIAAEGPAVDQEARRAHAAPTQPCQAPKLLTNVGFFRCCPDDPGPRQHPAGPAARGQAGNADRHWMSQMVTLYSKR